jgi:hypothetical protein
MTKYVEGGKTQKLILPSLLLSCTVLNKLMEQPVLYKD